MNSQAIPNGSTPKIAFLLVGEDGETAVSGVTPTVQISKNGGAFATATNAAAEIGSSGFYTVTLTATETGTNGPLCITASHASAKTWRDIAQIVDAVPDVNVASVDAMTLDANIKSIDATYTGANFVMPETALEQIAAYVARYALADVEAATTIGGVTIPALDFQSLAGAVARLVNSFAVDEINETLTIYQTDGTTTLGQQDITTSATAKPLTSGTTT